MAFSSRRVVLEILVAVVTVILPQRHSLVYLSRLLFSLPLSPSPCSHFMFYWRTYFFLFSFFFFFVSLIYLNSALINVMKFDKCVPVIYEDSKYLYMQNYNIFSFINSTTFIVISKIYNILRSTLLATENCYNSPREQNIATNYT